MGRYAVQSDLAREFGVATAAVYDRLYELCREKAERNADYHDGRFYVRMPYKDFSRIFPFLSPTTVSRTLRRLIDEDLVTVGHYDGADKHNGSGGLANWYAIIRDMPACRPKNVLD